jgi:hypothetical protein
MLEQFGKVHAREPGIIVRCAVACDDLTSSIFQVEIWNRFKIYAAVTEIAEPDA